MRGLSFLSLGFASLLLMPLAVNAGSITTPQILIQTTTAALSCTEVRVRSLIYDGKREVRVRSLIYDGKKHGQGPRPEKIVVSGLEL